LNIRNVALNLLKLIYI